MCEHSSHSQASELSVQIGVGVGGGVREVLMDQLGEPWQASSSFIISLDFQITIGSRLSHVIITQSALNPALNPLNIANIP